ncbi:MAG: benenodin family lasso peptide [Hyphomonadaceae bacterium JAD_PAG50586_4]|nr:MAG: benenodin family lasso peptide [Hyphomonadaceae bacterium JAD_PAG50586_4]
MLEDHTTDEIIDLGAASEVTQGYPELFKVEAFVIQDHRN